MPPLALPGGLQPADKPTTGSLLLSECHDVVPDLTKPGTYFEPDPDLLELLKDPPPGNNVFKHEGMDPVILKKIIASRTDIKQATERIEKGFEILKVESALLGRLLYKQKNQFRNDHGYKYMQSLKKSVDKCCDNYPRTALSNLLSLLPQIYQYTAHLPPVSVCEHAALRTWLAVCSVDRVLHMSSLTAVQAIQRLHLGHIWEAATIRMAVTSRIWAVCCEMKKQVQCILSRLQIICSSVPDGSSIYSTEMLDKMFSLCPKETSNQNPVVKRGTEIVQDFGVKIKRPLVKTPETISIKEESKDTESKVSEVKKAIKEKGKMSVEDSDAFSFLSELHNYEQLIKFLEDESLQRKKCRKQSRTRRLSQDQWKSLKTEVLSSFKQKVPNKSMKLCRKIIRNSLQEKLSK